MNPTNRGGSAPPVMKSQRYDPRGRRVDHGGGVYWIGAEEFRTAVDRALVRPESLNAYRFEAIPARR